MLVKLYQVIHWGIHTHCHTAVRMLSSYREYFILFIVMTPSYIFEH